MGLLHKAMSTQGPGAVILIRLAVGGIFLTEGIQKFLHPDALGAGRFERIGFESASVLGPMVGAFEAVSGGLVLAGLATRLAALPLVGIMCTAIVTTKIPILLGQDLWGFQVRELAQYGFWSMAHETRTDFAMLTGALFLVVVGGGRCSVDAQLARPKDQEAAR